MFSNVYAGDPDRLIALTASILRDEANDMPIQNMVNWDWKGEMVNMVAIEEKTNSYGIVPLVGPNESPSIAEKGTRSSIPIEIPRFAKTETILVDEVAGVRGFGSEGDLESYDVVVAERQEKIRIELDQTKELVRAGAIRGEMIAARKDGTTYVAKDWKASTALNVNLLTHTITASNAAKDMNNEFVQIKRKSQLKHKGLGGLKNYVGFCGSNAFDKVTTHKSMRDLYLNWQAAAQLVEDPTMAPFRIATNVYLYDVGQLSYGGVELFDPDEIIVVPNGMGSFLHRNAPAKMKPFMGSRGLPYYSAEEPLKWGAGDEILGETHYIAFPAWLQAHVVVTFN